MDGKMLMPTNAQPLTKPEQATHFLPAAEFASMRDTIYWDGVIIHLHYQVGLFRVGASEKTKS